MYLALKHVHLTLVALSLVAFLVRGFWLFIDSSLLGKRWVRVLATVISAFLLASGIVLAMYLRMSPGNQPWLMAKIVGLIAYIGLGMAAFKVPNRNARKLLWVSALIVFAYVISVAVSKNPMGFLG